MFLDMLLLAYGYRIILHVHCLCIKFHRKNISHGHNPGHTISAVSCLHRMQLSLTSLPCLMHLMCLAQFTLSLSYSTKIEDISFTQQHCV